MMGRPDGDEAMTRTHESSHRSANRRHLGRRDLLRGGAAMAAAALLPTSAFGSPYPMLGPVLAGARKTKRVILVVFGGGVRSRDTILSDNVPNMARMAAEGVVFPNTVVRNNGHYGAAVSILSGSFEVFGIRENARPSMPTLFEIVRKQAGLAASDVWLSTSGSDQETNYAYSTAAGYGAPYGANLIGGEGIFNAEFKDLVVGDAGLRSVNASDEKMLGLLRGAMATPLPTEDGGGLQNSAAATARIETFILDELRGGASDITGLGSNDAKAMHVARNLMSIFRPKLLGVTLRNPDVAHGSYNDYVTVIRRNDEELGKLFDAVAGDPDLADSTAIMVLPEFGRDRDFNARRGLDHGDGSDELNKVALVAWGPDFKRGKVDTREIRSIDVTPTIVSMFGARTGAKTGSVIPGLFG
jgi:hypothetical protein